MPAQAPTHDSALEEQHIAKHSDPIPPQEAEEPEARNTMSELEHAIIALEKKNWRYQGRKEQAILNMGLSPIAYYQKLNSMIDDPRIIARYPVETDAWRARRESNM